MTGASDSPRGDSQSALRLAGQVLIAVLTAISAFLVFQNYALDILPDRRIAVKTEEIRPVGPEGSFAYSVPFAGGNADVFPNMLSRVRFFEDKVEYTVKLRALDEIILVGGARFAHEPGRIVFSTVDVDQTDPRTNGHHYSIEAPVLYGPSVGIPALLCLAACAVGWWAISRRRPAPRPAGGLAWRRHLVGASAVFLLGIYLNTGSMAPYATTINSVVIPSTGYVYNIDHPFFRATYDFVDGRPEAQWAHYTLLFRRILYPVLAWPFMKAMGFEVGGAIASLVFNLAGFVAALVLLRRFVGERAAVAAGWLLALYPGAAYWAGMPYSYAMIFPASLLLMAGLLVLSEKPSMGRICAVSLAMGVGYLAYDLSIFFGPAAFLVLCWRRRFGAAILSSVIQLAPSGAWILALTRVFRVSIANSNSLIYEQSLESLRGLKLTAVLHEAPGLLGSCVDIFVASGFIFLPALFVFAVVANCWSSRVRMHLAESALLLAGLAVFLFLNLPQSHLGSWDMRGDWISRLYQPLFPAMVLFIARWWQGLPETRDHGCLAWAAVLGASLGNGLIVFGPVLGDPFKLSQDAYYRFYDHTDWHNTYENTLRNLGRRPLGFPREIASAKPMSHAEVMARIEAAIKSDTAQLQAIRDAIQANQSDRNKILRGYRDVELAVAATRSAIAAVRLSDQVARGGLSAQAAAGQARTPQDFLSASDRELVGDHSIDGEPMPVVGASPASTAELLAAIKRDTVRLNVAQKEVNEANGKLSASITLLAGLQKQLKEIEDEDASRARH